MRYGDSAEGAARKRAGAICSYDNFRKINQIFLIMRRSKSIITAIKALIEALQLGVERRAPLHDELRERVHAHLLDAVAELGHAAALRRLLQLLQAFRLQIAHKFKLQKKCKKNHDLFFF